MKIWDISKHVTSSTVRIRENRKEAPISWEEIFPGKSVCRIQDIAPDILGAVKTLPVTSGPNHIRLRSLHLGLIHT